jgi:glycerophosphoryl diester phosphodiesterase
MRHRTGARSNIPPKDAGVERVLPRVIGHRGAAASAPENTLAGLRTARALGCQWVEFDVRLTADGEPVLLHDDQLERTTDGRGKLSALSLAAVRTHDAGAWFDMSFTGQQVPTLEEALMLLTEIGLGANIELKAARGREAATGAVVADLLERTWPSVAPQVLISSFQLSALAGARIRAPGIPRGVLFPTVPRNWRAVAERLGCVTIHADHRRLRPTLVSEIRRAGYPLLAYTVNDPRRAKTLFDWGVTSVFSDVPECLHGAAPYDGSPQRAMAELGSVEIPRQGSTR